MAQAFEIPFENSYGKPDSVSWLADGSPQAGHRQIPSNALQIAAPGPIQRRIGKWNMGSASDRRKRMMAALQRPETDPIPGPAIPARLIVSGGFDKGTRRPFSCH
jgi:hypothetical protein